MSDKKLAIDMTPEELDQWLETLEIEDTIPNYYFSNPDPYFKVTPPPPMKSPGIIGSARTDTFM